MTHEGLVQEIELVGGCSAQTARAVLALITERLKEPTEEMLKFAYDGPIISWRKMLAASPLAPPKSKE